MEIFIDFGGFYDSIHSEIVEYKIEIMSGDDYCILGNFENVNWRETYIEYSKNYIDLINEELDLNLSFIDLHSPRFYNYTTDKIVAKVSEEEVKTLFKHTYNNDFLEWANLRLTSRSGFHSFYDGIKGLLEMSQHYEKDQEVLIGLVIDWLITKEEINDNIFDLEIEIIYNELQN